MQPEAVKLDREQVEKLVREIAEKTLDLQRERSELDAAITEARKDRDKRIADLQAAIRAREDQVRAWAEDHREAFAGQSLDLRHGILSFRKGSWSVGFLDGWNAEKAIDALKKLKLRKWLRIKPELDRQKLLRERELVDVKEIARAGLTFTRGETFSIEPKLMTVVALKQAA